MFAVGTSLLNALLCAGPLCVLIWMLRHRAVRAGLTCGMSGAPPPRQG